MEQSSQTQSQKISGSYDPYNQKDVMPSNTSKFLTSCPNSLIFKLVKINNAKSYLLMDYFSHQVGPSAAKDTRSHVCLVSLGGEESPEKDAFFEAKRNLKGLRTDPTADKANIARQEAIAAKFKPTTRGWLVVVTPGNPNLQALKVPQKVVDAIFGLDEAKAHKFRPAQKGLLKEMLEERKSPFDLESDIGWIKITKTGEGINTVYVVKEHLDEVVEVIGGKKITTSAPAVAKIHPDILNLTVDQIPDIISFEKKYAFNLEEAREFVDSMGGAVPSRFLKKGNTQAAPQAETEVEATRELAKSEFADDSAAEVEDARFDDIPF